MDDRLSPVTTPYMKHLEIVALCRSCERVAATERMRTYWGGMLDADATTFFEAFNENESLADVAQFYERPFARSLCKSCDGLFVSALQHHLTQLPYII